MSLFASGGGPNRGRWFLPAVAVALLGAGLDIAQLRRDVPLWVDEEMIAINLRDRQLLELPGALWLAQSAPLAWLFAQRLVLVTLGSGEMMLRLVPLLFGIATLGAAVWIGRRWLHPLSAAVLVLIFALAQWLSHYRFEVKHYSADAFWALLLPALAAWAIEDDEEGETRGKTEWRWTRWWAIAALAQWTANGAFLVTPGCAVFAFAVILRRHGSVAAIRFAVTGTLWLASLGVHYLLSLQYAHHSHYLQNYWSAHLVPASIGLLDSVIWLGGRLDALASNPGGAPIGVALWAGAFCGFAVSHRRRLAGMFVTVPMAGFALAALRLVPLTDRLALWIIPSLYVGVTLLFERGVRLVAQGWRPPQFVRLATGALAACAGLLLAGDIAVNGYRQLDIGVPVHGNRGADDRSAVRWLMDRRQPGDAIVTTRLGWPALWWYGGIPLSRPTPGGRLRDGSVMYEISHERESPGCHKALQEALVSHRRLLVHVGFPDMPDGFYDLVVRQLSTLGRVVEEESFPYLSRAAVVELRHPLSDPAPATAFPTASVDQAPLTGCVTASIARRW
ncbi:MAG: hypothetical protein M3468_08100 [Acidobacteriota bacterium]|nr:hypothetical protein [Acidobacteriota bacterium]